MRQPYYQSDDGRITLYCCDCLELMCQIEPGSVDAVVTDPPYGVNLGKHGAANEHRPQFQAKRGYDGYDDTPENFEDVVVPAITKSIALANRAVVFVAGTQAWSFPRPSAVGGVYLPAGNGRCSWGFQNLAHCLFYGKCPDLNLGAKHIVLRSTEAADKSDHPCPKPLGWMLWAIRIASRDDELIFDPFTGSGTTAVACIKTGRRFIGCEIHEPYCEIAVKRIKDALAQPLLEGLND